jgi:hypothetical protein
MTRWAVERYTALVQRSSISPRLMMSAPAFGGTCVYRVYTYVCVWMVCKTPMHVPPARFGVLGLGFRVWLGFRYLKPAMVLELDLQSSVLIRRQQSKHAVIRVFPCNIETKYSTFYEENIADIFLIRRQQLEHAVIRVFPYQFVR